MKCRINIVTVFMVTHKSDLIIGKRQEEGTVSSEYSVRIRLYVFATSHRWMESISEAKVMKHNLVMTNNCA